MAQYVRLEKVAVTGSKGFLATCCQGYVFDLARTGISEICVLGNEACAMQKFPPLFPEDRH